MPIMTSAGAAPDGSATAAAAALYQRPFAVLRRSAIGVRGVIQSAKLTPGALDANRYYVDVENAAPPAPPAAIAELERVVAALRMPDAARRRLDVELVRFGDLRFIGVGNSHGRMAFRIYLGFAGAEERTGHSAVSIDWDPVSGEHFLKDYDELRAVPRARALAVLDDLLLADAGGALPELAGEVHRFMTTVTGRARGTLHVTLVREPGGQRSSASFNYRRCAVAGNADLLPELDRLAGAMALPPSAYHAWRARTAFLPIVDIAAGRGADGVPFVTIYHGPCPAPLPYLAPPAVAPPRAAARHAPAPRPLRAYALGRLAYDFGSRVRREAFQQAGLARPDEPGALLAFLDRSPAAAASLLWVLAQDTRPLYALRPAGAFAASTHARLRQLLAEQERQAVERVSVPGWVSGSATLESGEVLPLLEPEPRGMCGWTPASLLAAAPGAPPGKPPGKPRPNPPRKPPGAPPGALPDADGEPLRAALGAFFARLDAALRNPGLAPRDRALNFAATDAWRVGQVFAGALAAGLALADLAVAPHPAARRDADLWDVELTFFDPARRVERARRVYRLTVDVSDVVPVGVGAFRHWDVY